MIAAYEYTNDAHSRRTSISKSGTMMEGDEVQPYAYNTRDELISGQGLTYDYDDIGNRIEAEGRDYTADNLNQYTAIDTFTPTYDLDGNQTKILTSTGEWNVEYNAENRPVRWTQGNIIIEMAYDRMGRRIVYHETRNGSNYIYAKFVYDGYLCIQRLYGASNGVYQSFVWDPTESVATRPLCMQVPSWGATVFYMHDGNKNVSDVIYYAVANGIAAHYDYAPFGAVTRTARDTYVTHRDFIGENPFRFSSEYHDNTLGLVYYNYRHYNPMDGRWCRRDRQGESESRNLYNVLSNSIISSYDYLGDSRRPATPTVAEVYPMPPPEAFQGFSCNSMEMRVKNKMPSNVCCTPSSETGYSIIFYGDTYQDPRPITTRNDDGTIHVVPRRLVLGVICVYQINRYCISSTEEGYITRLIEEKKGVYEENAIANIWNKGKK